MIKKDDYIVTAYAQRAAGPGWANSPLWVIVRDSGHKMREECLQPREQSPEIWALYHISEAVHNAMIHAVRQTLAKKKRRKK